VNLAFRVKLPLSIHSICANLPARLQHYPFNAEQVGKLQIPILKSFGATRRSNRTNSGISNVRLSSDDYITPRLRRGRSQCGWIARLLKGTRLTQAFNVLSDLCGACFDVYSYPVVLLVEAWPRGLQRRFAARCLCCVLG